MVLRELAEKELIISLRCEMFQNLISMNFVKHLISKGKRMNPQIVDNIWAVRSIIIKGSQIAPISTVPWVETLHPITTTTE